MKKRNLTKVLALALCLIMSLSALTLFASANTAPTFAKTVYMKSTGVDTNDGLTEATPVKTLEKASDLVGENGGEIVVLDDIIQDVSGYAPDTTAGCRVYMNKTTKSNATVYVHGVDKGNGEYTSLRFGKAPKQHSATAYGTILELNGPLAFYNIVLGTECESSVAANDSWNPTDGVTCNLWISANAYPLTIGNNVSFKFSYSGTTNGNKSAANICGGRQDNKNSYLLNTNTELPSVINIFSGNLGQVHAGSFNNSTGMTGDATVNVMGGTIASLITKRAAANDSECNYTINYYDGTVTNLDGYAGTTATHTLNIIGKTKAEATGIAAYANVYTDDTAKINESVAGTTPTFFAISAYSTVTAAPPAFEEDPDLAADDEEETKAEDTKAETTKAADETTEAAEDEEVGCGGVIGAGAIVIAAVIGSAALIGKKKED